MRTTQETRTCQFILIMVALLFAAIFYIVQPVRNEVSTIDMEMWSQYPTLQAHHVPRTTTRVPVRRTNNAIAVFILLAGGVTVVAFETKAI